MADIYYLNVELCLSLRFFVEMKQTICRRNCTPILFFQILLFFIFRSASTSRTRLREKKKSNQKVQNSNKDTLSWFYLQFNTWYLILVTWYLLPGTCYLMLATWYLIPDSCLLILCLQYLLVDKCNLRLVTKYFLTDTFYLIHISWYLHSDQCYFSIGNMCLLPETGFTYLINTCFELAP